MPTRSPTTPRRHLWAFWCSTSPTWRRGAKTSASTTTPSPTITTQTSATPAAPLAIPAGTGGAVMANSKVEVFGNTFHDISAAGFSAISCFAALGQSASATEAKRLQPVALADLRARQHLHQQRHQPAGRRHRHGSPDFQLAALLASGFQGCALLSKTVTSPNVSYNGILHLAARIEFFPELCTQTTKLTKPSLHLDNFGGRDPNLREIIEAFQRRGGVLRARCKRFPLLPVPAFLIS